MDLSEIRGRDERQLLLDLQELQKEHFDLRFRGFAEGVARTSRFRQIKRTVARILTVLAERRQAATVASASAAPTPAPSTTKAAKTTATKRKKAASKPA